MNSTQESDSKIDPEKMKILLVGTLAGAVMGTFAAYLLVQRAERQNTKVSLSTGEGIRLALLVLGLLRSVALLGDGDK
jgi:hypothetical protein